MNEFFKYLDELHEIGDINMFDAALPLMERFGLSADAAYSILEEWMFSHKG